MLGVLESVCDLSSMTCVPQTEVSDPNANSNEPWLWKLMSSARLTELGNSTSIVWLVSERTSGLHGGEHWLILFSIYCSIFTFINNCKFFIWETWTIKQHLHMYLLKKRIIFKHILCFGKPVDEQLQTLTLSIGLYQLHKWK